MTSTNDMLLDRNPNLDEVHEGQAQEQNKQLEEMMQSVSSLSRKQKRKVFKPTYSQSVRNAFKKNIAPEF